MVPMNIQVNYTENIPRAAHDGEWYDLCTAEPYSLHKGETKLLSLGFACEIPAGYEALIIPRSSTHRKWNILQANSVGLIDNLYRGKDDIWLFPAYATEDTTIPQFTRICQFRLIHRQEPIAFNLVNELGSNNRGGIGSTGA